MELAPTEEEKIASGTRSYRKREDREWNSLLPLPLLIFLLKKQQKLEAFLRRESFRLVAIVV